MWRLCAKLLFFFLMLAGFLPAVLFTTGCELSGLVGEETVFENSGTGKDRSDGFHETVTADSPKEICVHVCGCVNKPGLYRLTEGSRVAEAIDAAGGFSKNANQDAWNLAAILTDGQQVCVPSEGEEISEAGGGQPAGGTQTPSGIQDAGGGRVNINTASAEELTQLNGIGPTRAADIVAYRQENGPFKTIDEIRNVSGIGDSIFDKIKDRITVS